MKILEKLPKKQSTQERELAHSRRIVNKFFSHLETRGGIVGDKAILFVYNVEAPELSYILTEQL